MPKYRPAIERFQEKIFPEPNTGCWYWFAALDSKGYGQFWDGKKRVYAHRFSYIYLKGEIPSGLVLDHLCRVPCCVNPDHLDAVTQAVNTARGETGINQRRKTHCPRGHAYTAENLLQLRTRNERVCKTCHRLRMRRRREELAAEAMARGWIKEDGE